MTQVTDVTYRGLVLPHSRTLTALISLAALGALASPPSIAAADPAKPRPAAERAAAARQITYAEWDTGAAWRTGAFNQTRVAKGALVVKKPTKTRKVGGRRYDVGAWVSPWSSPGFSLSELISSWSAVTPNDSFIEVRMRARNGASTGSWDVLGRWTSGDRYLKRQTFSGQTDDLGKVNVDTWQTSGATSYQLQVSLMRRHGAKYSPSVDTIGAMSSRLPAGRVATSKPGVAAGKVLPVPAYSQMTHSGHYPQFGGGGEAWCSPTSTSMVLGYYKKLPAPAEYGWVGTGHTDPVVDFAARSTFDHAYDGTGNWPFNTAYAGPRVGKAFVTRLRSLHEAERFIAAGIPLIASISFGAGELDGAPISSTAGHLLVIVGFTEDGDVVVNDPAASTGAGVRRTYDRAQFENVWVPKSGGLVYVIRDAAHPLPAGNQTNW